MLIFVMCTLCALILGVCGGNWPLAFIVFMLGLFSPLVVVAFKIALAIVDGITRLISSFWRVDECD